jgi:hypothetical protein
MGRRRRGSLAGSPLLIGAVTLIAVVACSYYNANNGLPFVPTYDVKWCFPGPPACSLQPGTDRGHARG